jgi:urea carboxylase
LFQKVLIANRGAIACRIARTLKRLNVASVAVYSEADVTSLHVEAADEAILIGPGPAAQSYLNIDAILKAAQTTGAQAIHPGYGFLSENAEFAEACSALGIAFIGPTPAQMRAFGLKHTARQLATQAKVPLLPGSDLLSSVEEAIQKAENIGFPVMLKSTAGGGGIGMRLCRNATELADSFAAVKHLGRANFKNDGLYLERFVEVARHVEVQIFGDGKGKVVALGERDCSLQRRNQKVVEETPAPNLSPQLRAQLLADAIRLGESVQYANAGTVEFLFDEARQEAYFLEVNTRLQVEHGVTEEVTGIDLVEWMVKQAAGDPLDLRAPEPCGASIQVRLYAEDPNRDFQPNSGTLTQVLWPAARMETWVEAGTDVSPFYDPLLAKIIVKGKDRADAVHQLRLALRDTKVAGIETNLDYLRQVTCSNQFADARVSTKFLNGFPYRLNAFEVIDGGTQTTVQDWPGRLGYWEIGVPPSGPMDARAFRLANRLVGNDESAAGLEITMFGPTLKFHSDALIAITGAPIEGAEVGIVRSVSAGETIRLGAVTAGARSYLAVRGGIDVPEYLGSRSTFILGQFGGHGGHALRAGDVLRIGKMATADAVSERITDNEISNDWQIGVLIGPHCAPDFFTAEGLEEFFSTQWKVHHQSDRTGVRLIGPKPKFARADGGDAGLHPSNLHDNAYAVGALDITGDTPILLGPDGPSLGGFVCPCVVAEAERWKLGQLRSGDALRFVPISEKTAADLHATQEKFFNTLQSAPVALPANDSRDAIISRSADVITRQAGDRYFLVEFGEHQLDLGLRMRAHAMYQWFQNQKLAGILDLTPGIRSLQIHYDGAKARREDVLHWIEEASTALKQQTDIQVPSRTVHLPLSWDDPQTRKAVETYLRVVRADAPWCTDSTGRPTNIEFIRRINGLGSEDEVRRIVFDASYLVFGLGDVYLGAPVATPFDPRHRLVTTKYNPARTWTPENAVGIGGAYMCIYGMEGPGGYQFVGRTLQTWNRYRQTPAFQPGHPWLLRFFDQIKFYPVGAEELLEMRQAFPRGGLSLNITEGSLQLSEYQSFLQSIQSETKAFEAKRKAAFAEERERWRASGADLVSAIADVEVKSEEVAIPEGCIAVRAPITASVWQVPGEAEQQVQAGDKLVVLEAMKMEVAVTSAAPAKVVSIHCQPGALVQAGQVVAVVRPLSSSNHWGATA